MRLAKCCPSGLMAQVTELSPASRTERIASLDFVRGVAVLGILAANIVAFALAGVEQSWPALLGPVSPGSSAYWTINYLLVDGKMRSLFAILFGAGVALFVDRADGNGHFGLALQLRRLVWLALFGLLHFLFLFRGDILFTYALWGFVAMFAAGLKPRLLIGLAVLLYLLPVPFEYISYTPPPAGASAMEQGMFLPLPDPAALREDAARDIAAMGSGSFGEIVGWRIDRYLPSLFAYASQARSDSFPMMLIGIALFRLGFFARAPGSARIRLWGWALALAGIAFGLLQARAVLATGFSMDAMRQAIGVWAPLQRLTMTLGWLFLLAGYCDRLARGPMGERFLAAGRMAFTNYIAMSLVMAIIFQGWGLGLFGACDRGQLFGFVLLGWALMLGWSKPWLDRFRYGPLEWLWRCLTYWQLFAMRRPATRAAPN